jgi:hypothetical protein
MVWRSEGKRHLPKSRRKCEINIEMKLQDIGCCVYELDQAGSE